MQADLRSFLMELEDAGKLERVAFSVDLAEVPTKMHQAEREGRTIIFEAINGYNYPLVYNILGGREFLARAFKCQCEEVVPEFIRRSKKPIEPELIDKAPVQEEIETAGNGKLSIEKFPFPVHSAKDAGRYITAGMVIAKDLETGIRNVSINRMQLKGADRLGIRMMPPQHLGVIYAKAEELEKPLEVAVAIGNHPLDLIAATTSTSLGVDELGIAGGLRGEALKVVKCKTVDLEVPAFAELVIEGEVRPYEREAEGPFGDFMGYYVPVMDNHVLHIKAITHRRNPILQTMMAGSIEDTHLLALSREARVYEAVKATGTEIKALSLCPMIFTCIISIRKRFADEARNVMMAAFGSYSWMKICIVVDHDVNAFDIADVWWAISTRCRPDKGVLVIPDAVGFPRDPYQIHQSKLGIDATIPLGEWQEFERTTLPAGKTV
ncbi:UbiD family decarboxylase [Moorella naiadis]|uniref:UbiD family decarboxylase n=1 Tax=Moorella naiadis (nom. illeg.) TaxID=3093670 RepID=UPI003D9C98C8